MICMLACCWLSGESTGNTFSSSLLQSHSFRSHCLIFCLWSIGSAYFLPSLSPFFPLFLPLSSLLSAFFSSYSLLPPILSSTVPRGPMEPPGGQGEMERSGGPHSDSGSISPTWERDRRGPPPGPPGPLGPPGVWVRKRDKEKEWMSNVSQSTCSIGKAWWCSHSLTSSGLTLWFRSYSTGISSVWFKTKQESTQKLKDEFTSIFSLLMVHFLTKV